MFSIATGCRMLGPFVGVPRPEVNTPRDLRRGCDDVTVALSTCLDSSIGFALGCCHRPAPPKEKKPTWWNTLRYSTTSAYSLTDPPVRPGYPSSSHPTTSRQFLI